MLYDVIIVGAASSGLTAALYTSRQGLKTLVVSKDMGGQALLTNEIQNYPGFSSIGGFELLSKFEEQARSFGANIVYDEVLRIKEKSGVCFEVETPNGKYETCTLILAFGKTPRDLGVPGEDKFKGKGVSYCAVCDGPLFKGKTVAVVGSSDPALDAALFVGNLAKKVCLIHQWDKPVGDDDFIRKVKTKDNVEWISNSRVVEIKGDSKVRSLLVQDARSATQSEIAVDGVFIEMGYVARTEFVRDLVQLNGKGEVIVDKNCATSHPGIFAAGDVTNTPFKQVVISAGQGATAALSAYNYIQSLRGKPAVKADWKIIERPA